MRTSCKAKAIPFPTRTEFVKGVLCKSYKLFNKSFSANCLIFIFYVAIRCDITNAETMYI